MHRLERFIVSRGIKTAQWGMDEAKTLTALWHAILTGEASTHDKPIRQVVHVVQVIGRKNSRVLLWIFRKLSAPVKAQWPSYLHSPGALSRPLSLCLAPSGVSACRQTGILRFMKSIIVSFAARLSHARFSWHASFRTHG